MNFGVEAPISHDFPRVSTRRVVEVLIPVAKDTARRLHESPLLIDLTQRVTQEIHRARRPNETTQHDSIPQADVIYTSNDFVVDGQPGLSIYEL